MLSNKENQMKRFGPTFFGNEPHFEHRAKNGTANSTSKKRGNDGKLNNTSEYNHKYYEQNKARWQDNPDKDGKRRSLSDDDDQFYDKDGKPKFGHVDIDENDWDAKRDGKKIEGTNLKIVTSSDGGVVVVGNGIKFRFPPGTKISSSMERKLAEIENANKSDKNAGKNKTQYIANMLNAVTGYYDKEKEYEKKKKKSSKKSESAETPTDSKKSDKNRSILEAYSDYKEDEKKKKQGGK